METQVELSFTFDFVLDRSAFDCFACAPPQSPVVLYAAGLLQLCTSVVVLSRQNTPKVEQPTVIQAMGEPRYDKS